MYVCVSKLSCMQTAVSFVPLRLFSCIAIVGQLGRGRGKIKLSYIHTPPLSPSSLTGFSEKERERERESCRALLIVFFSCNAWHACIVTYYI